MRVRTGRGAPSVVFLNRFYWPDVAATAQLLTELAEDLADAGWHVTVLTSDAEYGRPGHRLPALEVRHCVRIRRVRGTRLGRAHILGRMADYATYTLGAFLALLRMERPALVVAMTDPPLLALPALIAARLRGARFVYWVQDLYPELAARLGIMRRSGVTHRLAAALARRVHARSHALVAVAPAMARELVTAGAPRERTAVIQNWVDTRTLRPLERAGNPLAHEHGLGERFVVLYSGNAGRAHTFDAVLGAIQTLRAEPDVLFLFAGAGQQTSALRAATHGCENVRFLGYAPRERLSESLSLASAFLVTEAPAAIGCLLPSKTYGALACGRPLLFVGSEESDVAAIVRAAECGITVSPDDPTGLVNAIRQLRAHPAERAAMGARARAAAERLYDRGAAATAWHELLHAVLEGAAAPALQRSPGPSPGGTGASARREAV